MQYTRGFVCLQPATNTGPTKPLPDKQMLRTLEHFVEVLESEKLVFSHNLGVHSGTAVIEDLVARKLWELCNRAHTLITMKDKCMEVFLSFCERLTAEKRNRMLTAFSVFDKEDLLDYVQLVRPHLVKDAITAPISPTVANYGAIFASAPRPSSVAAGNSSRPGVQVFRKSAPFVSRVEALRKAGHPFLKIVDRIIEVRIVLCAHNPDTAAALHFGTHLQTHNKRKTPTRPGILAEKVQYLLL